MHIQSISSSSSCVHSPSSLFEKLEKRNQGFYTIFETEAFEKEVLEMKKYYETNKNKFDDIVVCGIGGSALGLIALIESVGREEDFPSVHVVENIDPDMIHSVHSGISYERTLFIIISKSGGTIETLAQYSFFVAELQKRNCVLSDHCVIITGSTGFLREEASLHHIPVFSVPENIGGRFSVLTSVGLFPALWKGIDIDALLLGAQEMNRLFQNANHEENLPFQFAHFQYASGKPIQVLMPYASRLRSLALWYAQLLAESTGKAGKGYTMLPSVGATDQHSQIQLFTEGPKDKAITLLTVENFPHSYSFHADFLQGDHSFSFAELLQAEAMGTKKSLEEKEVPLVHLSLHQIHEYEMGQLLFFFEGATAFLGEMMEIDAFDQPGVERGKILAKEMLIGSSPFYTKCKK